jgi:zinc D-Ala-D-Ala carboxypeptidase
MTRVITSIVALFLSLNAYTVVYEDSSNIDRSVDNRYITDISVEENILGEELKPVLSRNVPVSNSNAWWVYPTDIKAVTRSGDDLLVLVNKEYQLPSTYAPSDLVSICSNVSNIRCVNNTNFLARNILISDLQNLANAAVNDGIDLSIRSAYRSYNVQVSTYNHWLSVNGGSVAATDRISARAGHSEHQLGTTLDFSTNEINDGLGGTFASTRASKWLADNAWKYGFVISYPAGYEHITGYSYESWHYRYIGRENAQEMVNSGMILLQYLRSKN